MKVLIACEFSGIVRDAFAALGHEAWSCDLLPSDKPGPHLMGDVRQFLGECQANNFKHWDLMIAFPPCTHLALSGAAWFEQKRKDGRQQEGIDFFMAMVNAPIEKIAVENPVGIMGKLFKRPTQIIQPFYFGDEARKTTCLWLKNLPPLYHNAIPTLFDPKVTHVGEGEVFEWTETKTGKTKKMPLWYAQAKGFGGKATGNHSKTRSKTFHGVADAMAAQWSNIS